MSANPVSRIVVVGAAVAIVLAASGCGGSTPAAKATPSTPAGPSTAASGALQSDDRVARASLRNGLTAAETLYTDKGDFSDVNPSSLATVEPTLTFTSGPTTSPTDVAVAVSASNQTIVLAARSHSGRCYYLRDGALQGGNTSARRGVEYAIGTAKWVSTCSTGDSAAWSQAWPTS